MGKKHLYEALSANEGSHGSENIIALLQHQGKSLPVSEDVLKIAAAANHGICAYETVSALPKHQGENDSVSQEEYKIALPTTRVIPERIQRIQQKHSFKS